jgi:flavin-dependent dehydrogenase
MNSSAHSADIFIVGGGPAGLATAILAAQRGLRVAAADHNVFPIDKACGEGLMPDTLTALKTLGVDLMHGDGISFRGIRFRDGESANSVEAQFGQSCGLGIRRTVLHARLVERAAELGVVLLWGSRVTLKGDGRILCEGEPVRSKWVIGADGEPSPFRKWAALEEARHEHIRFAARQHFQTIPWTDFVEVYWGRDCQITVAPIAAGELCVSLTSRTRRLRFRDALEQVPALASRLRNLPGLGKLRGARAASRRLRRVYRDRLALVGDASGSVDPLTGEGIGLAFKQAAELVEAITRNDLRAYQAAHNGIGRAPRLMSRFMLTMDAHPHFRRRALSIMASEPSLFSRLLQFNVGTPTLSKVGFGDALRFGWRMLIPGCER